MVQALGEAARDVSTAVQKEEKMENQVTLQEVLELASLLSSRDKLRLIERIAPQIEHDLEAAQPKQRKSLRGLWKGLDISEEDIEQARREMWNSFPRENI